MAYTATQLQQLIDLRASGKLRVQLGDRVIVYQSGADLDTAIANAQRDIATASGASSKTRRYPEYARG